MCVQGQFSFSFVLFLNLTLSGHSSSSFLSQSSPLGAGRFCLLILDVLLGVSLQVLEAGDGGGGISKRSAVSLWVFLPDDPRIPSHVNENLAHESHSFYTIYSVCSSTLYTPELLLEPLPLLLPLPMPLSRDLPCNCSKVTPLQDGAGEGGSNLKRHTSARFHAEF